MSQSQHLCCAICLENCTSTDVLSLAKCGHLFHRKCIRKWVLQTQKCAECRQFVHPRELTTVELDFQPDAAEIELEEKLKAAEAEQVRVDKEIEQIERENRVKAKKLADGKKAIIKVNAEILELKRELEEALNDADMEEEYVPKKKEKVPENFVRRQSNRLIDKRNAANEQR